jgi:hypothetical protein
VSPAAHALRTLACASAACACLAASAADWAELPLPPRSQPEMVLNNGRVNGLATHIQRFTTELTPAEVLQFYRQRWTRPGQPEPREVAKGAWTALSMLDGQRQVTVQTRADGNGAEALLTQMDISQAQRDFVPRELPKPYGVQVLQVTESQDGGQRSRLVSMVSDEAYDLQVQRWRQAWQQQGWTAGQTHEQKRPDGVRLWLASFARDRASADQVLTYEPRQRRSFTTVNLLDAPR